MKGETKNYSRTVSSYIFPSILHGCMSMEQAVKSNVSKLGLGRNFINRTFGDKYKKLMQLWNKLRTVIYSFILHSRKFSHSRCYLSQWKFHEISCLLCHFEFTQSHVVVQHLYQIWRNVWPTKGHQSHKGLERVTQNRTHTKAISVCAWVEIEYGVLRKTSAHSIEIADESNRLYFNLNTRVFHISWEMPKEAFKSFK